MLTPEEMATYPDNIDEMYQELDEFIIKDYARRVAKAGRVTDTAEWIAQRGEAIGLSEEEIRRETARILEMSEEEVEEIFEDAALTSADNDAERFASAGITAGRASSYAAVVRFLDAATKQTGGELKNITGTMGVVVDNEEENLTEFYQRTLDYVQLQVSSGVSDYNTAIRNAIKKLAAKGIQFIDYESGKRMNIASAARMCTLTGIGQMARQMNEAVCDDLGFDIVETTAHPGARPSHMVWQGRLFSRSGRSKQYPPLEQSTGLGTAGGLCGVNCRHSYYGVPEGATRTWTDEELANIDPPPFTYEGKEYTYYEANQRMRYMERQMRKTKREAVGYEAAGLDDDFTAASIKLNRQRQEYKKFAKAAGIRPKNERSQELGYNKSVSQKAVHARKKIEKRANLMYDTGNEADNVKAYLRDKPIRDKIQSSETKKTLEKGQYLKHVPGSHEYKQYQDVYQRKGQYGPSYLTVPEDEVQALVDEYAGTGVLKRGKDGRWLNEEVITIHPDNVGVVVNNINGVEAETSVFKIKYGKKGVHVIPDYPSKKGAKGK